MFKFIICIFYQILIVGANHHDILHSAVFDGQMLDSTVMYLCWSENDFGFKEFITDSRMIQNGGHPNFEPYGTTVCCKSLHYAGLIIQEKPVKNISKKI